MNRSSHALALMLSFTTVAACVTAGGSADDGEDWDSTDQAATCAPKPVYYPVRGKHDHGYDSKTANKSGWTCNDERSNSDYNKDHSATTSGRPRGHR